MRVTVIAEDNIVLVEGFGQPVDLTELYDSGIHAIQWYGTFGEVEYYNGPGVTNIRGNTHFDDFSPFQYLVDAWEVAARAA